MLRIDCPYCGLRDEPEYVYGGPANLRRPRPEVSDGDWTAYLYERENPVGRFRERWLHAYGCGRWFILERNTVTHEILRVDVMEITDPMEG